MARIGTVTRQADGWTVPFIVSDAECPGGDAETLLSCVHRANALQKGIEASAASAVAGKAAIDAAVTSVLVVPAKA